ncbi:hypothetical protein CK203_108122 [Vitis vinifera]|uniref:Uncharacterized protein n=1 Tax=Vitis vinifera TaxID=29760 RepID=A0A438DK37_VITVI|nr:hypothetical protein CK203_108122 [Vitis vinifera]
MQSLVFISFGQLPTAKLDKLLDFYPLVISYELLEVASVLLYDSRLHIFLGKLKSRWISPFIIHQVHLNGVVELLNSNSTDTFKVNGHRLKPFIELFKQDKEEINLLEP